MTRSRVAVLALVLGSVLAGILVLVAHHPSGAAGTAAATPRRDPSSLALGVLHEWDARRAAAYARGSETRLADLYLAGSAAGAADVRLLRSYRLRGFRVEGMRTQVLALTVLRRGPDRWTLRVTDRLARAVAVRAGRRLVLPRDTSSTRVLTMRQAADGRWRMASVQDSRAAS